MTAPNETVPLNNIEFHITGAVILTVFDEDGDAAQVARETNGKGGFIIDSQLRAFGDASAGTMALIADFLSGELDTDVKPPRWTDGDVVVETTPYGEKTWVRAGAWTAPGHVGHVTTDESVDNLLDNPPAGYSGTVLRQQSVSK